MLVRGPLLAGRAEGRYRWLTHEIVDAQLPLLVADTGLALSEFHLEKNRAEKAIEALNAALRTAPKDERLWNELLRATHSSTTTGGSPPSPPTSSAGPAPADCRPAPRHCSTNSCPPGATRW
ncbi:hypothetical protein SHKM778_07080 [Streptomyces sp. KM77-8]|uniref:Bacterial transcriptional activator domain-containing protein n=1 Tax=Streptomyces haneummycinicus TaxID=3074435 RepID=A0AAT9HAR6_9ACTN